MTRRLSGNHAGWLTVVAREIREAGEPVSLDFLCRVVPGQFATSQNDGHVTAAENGLARDDFAAGQRIWVEEAVAALERAKLVSGNGGGLAWQAEQDGEWRVQFGKTKITVRGRSESQASRDRHMLGEGFDQPGYLLKGWAEPLKVDVETGINGVIDKGERVLDVHPYALTVPPMTQAEQEEMRADIERWGVRVPLVLYPDATDLSARGKPKYKVLDGRHRLYFASSLGKPVRVELFKGSDEEARRAIVSLNFMRRQLTSAQKGLSIERLFGEQARQAATVAEKAGVKQPGNPGVNLPEGGRWEDRAVKAAGGGISPRSVRHMAEVAKAPETAAKVERGEITTVTAAVKEAAIELGKPEPTNVWQDSVRGELSRARTHLGNVLDKLDLPAGRAKPGELAGLIDEIEQAAREIRSTLAARGQL